MRMRVSSHLMAKQTLVLLLLFVWATLGSCGSYYCGDAEGLRITPVGFSSTEIEAIIVRRFIKGTGFNKFADSLQLDKSNTGFEFSNDTATMYSLNPDNLLKSRYDYEIYFPAVNRLVKIADINEPHQKMKGSLFSTEKTYCVNAILSFTQDGHVITMQSWRGEVYIHK